MKHKKPILRPTEPDEVVTRIQESRRVMLLIWKDRHTWAIWDTMSDFEPFLVIKIDRALDQQELFRWLAKTQPIE